MVRKGPLILVCVGTTMFGVACGLVYIDGRGKAWLPGPEDKDATTDVTPGLVTSMVIGPLGAGLGLAGLCWTALLIAASRGKGGECGCGCAGKAS